METLQTNIKLQKNFLVMTRTFEIGSLSEVIKSSYESKDALKQGLVPSLISFIKGLIQDFQSCKDLLNSHICEHTLHVLDTILFNLFTKQKKEERQIFNNDIYEGSQQSVMSRFQNSEISSVTVANFQNQINEQFIQNFKQFFQELSNNKEFFQNLEELFLQHRPKSELRSALKSLIKTIVYIQQKEDFQNSQLDENIKPLTPLYTTNLQLPNIKVQIDEVNKILFGNKLDKIVRILTSKEIIGSQQEVHFAVGRIYFAAHSRNRSNFNRNAFKQIKHTGKDLIYNLIRHYVVNQSPDKQKTQICSQKDTEKYPIPAFILNYLQLLFMPIYNQFQELFDKHIMEKYTKNQEQFYSEIFSTTTQFIIPFFQNLPIEFCNFFTQFYQIIYENHEQFSDKLNDLFPVKQLFVNRFFLNPHLRLFLLPISQEKEKDYVEALNWFSKLFYNNSKQDKFQSQNSFFLKLNSIIQDCFSKIVTNYHQFTQSSGHIDVYNMYLVDPILKKDYNFLYELIKLISFSEHEQKDYQIYKFKQIFPVKKRIEQKLQMDIIREIATPINENISQKMNDDSPVKSQQQQIQEEKLFLEREQKLKAGQSSFQQAQPITQQSQKSKQDQLTDYQNQLLLQQIQQQQQQIQELQRQKSSNTISSNQNFNHFAMQQGQNNSINIIDTPSHMINPGAVQYGNPNYLLNNANSFGSAINNNNFTNTNNSTPMNNIFTKLQTKDEGFIKNAELQGMYVQGNYQELDRDFLKQQAFKYEQIKQKIEQEQQLIDRFIQKNEEENFQKSQAIKNHFQQYNQQQEEKNYDDRLKENLEKQITDLYEKHINSMQNQIQQNEFKSVLQQEILMLHERNEFLKLILKQRYPTEIDYIDSLDNQQSIDEWKKSFEQQERKEGRLKRNQEDDEFYILQNNLNREFQKVEEADIKLQIHRKVNAELF
ncbi:hypothetical protein TTHERM_00560050 (macronuclear) [Tetrahymena thermophila SB210]|uniref:Uncharacterized protein n=1 Tax=Tetrahymena thermophila (strain SB210) TaxID=312017 RepID=I7LU52_TETTS|nr:hypothetical protein TTHERM_00560050 [Tetrahymena thermophila SB210]EAR89914.2 hypothetical protein TTHERM_00560050 [Tetrahymena thermophila SB210]|eukprot:XP_001010159.2 hypothetical protein TTHERM_00560050 [Tetrahymena thermophila SB210]